jgi:ppGpp synthetase/RelA/SpoT-type nucleotidyltranferase
MSTSKSVLTDDDRRHIAAQIEQYEGELPAYRAYAELLERVLRRAKKSVAPDAFVQTRVKTIASFAEKAARQRKDVRDPLRDFTDLCGARIIVPTRREVEAVCRFLEPLFTIDYKRSQDVSERLRVAEFGYTSIHFIVQVRRELLDPLLEADELDRLLPALGGRWAEIQVRTMLEHAWADVSHDRLYKVRIKVPRAWSRRMHGMAALIETANREFAATAAVIDDFLGNYERYLPRDELEAELADVCFAFEQEPGPQLALRVARLARAAERWDVAIDTIRVQLGHAVRERRDLQAELGHALCRRNEGSDRNQGLDLLRTVGDPDSIRLDDPSALRVERDPLRARALGWLASALDGEASGAGVRELCRKASLCDPDNPYLLAAYLEHRACWDRKFDGIAAAHIQIRSAIERCQQHAAVGVAIPDCYFAIGKLLLLLKQHEASIDTYAKAIAMSERVEQIDREASSLARLVRALDSPPDELEWTRLMLALSAASRRLESDPDAARADVAKLAQPLSIQKHAPLRPVLLVAGSATPMPEADCARYRDTLQVAFAGFAGTIYSGGTRAGIPGIVGDVVGSLRAQERRVEAIAYVPSRFPADGLPDHRYQLRETRTTAFTSLQPLCNWIELLLSGVAPREVRLLGIGGGPIAAFEYRLALALGATVGLVLDSGRAVRELQHDETPWPSGRLLLLPDDPMTIRAFVNPPQPAESLSGEPLDAAAQVVHDHYLEQTAEKRWAAPNLAPWTHLRDDFRQSCRDQAAYAVQILATEGYEVTNAEEVADDERIEHLESDAVRRMAEKEHGRWNVERLASGWRRGDVKDAERRISPFIAKWLQLPGKIQEYDLEAVKNWPAMLARAGLAIRKRHHDP